MVHKILLILLFNIIFTISSFGQNSVMDFYEADVAVLRMDFEPDYIPNPIIKVKDVQNGYISYDLQDFGIMGFKEMAYFISDNDKKFVAVATFSCGPACSISDFKILELQNGELVDKTEIYLPTKLLNQLNEATFPYIDKEPWIKVPQQGLNIEFGYAEGPVTDDSEVIFVCALQFNVADGTFTFVEK